MKLSKVIKSVIPNAIRNVIIRDILKNATLSYSQEGEDMILARIFGDKKEGFYVDIGAHHPQRFSNTMIFYKRGWNGINVDAMPGSMTAFIKERPKDINLEIPVSDKEEILIFYAFNDPALNTFSDQLAKQYVETNQYFVVSEIPLKTRTLTSILDRYLPENQQIDFLSIDVEGFDTKVLKSINWTKIKPTVVLVEVTGICLELLYVSELVCYMQDLTYRLYAKTCNTLIFKLD